MEFNDFLHVGKTETKALHIVLVASRHTVILVEYLTQVFLLDADTIVTHGEVEFIFVIPRPEPDVYRLVRLAILHGIIYQIVDNGYDNIGLVIPSTGTSYEIGATAIFKGAKHENAAKLWIEYALSPACVELGVKNGSYQFLVIDNAQQPAVATEFGLDPENVMKYDFEDAKQNTAKYIEDVMNALGGGDDRFKTE